MHFALVNAYILRVVYNLAITEMTVDDNVTNILDECPQYTYTPVVKEETRTWENRQESLTLYSFYIGYMIGHLPGGWLADSFGARPVMGTCMLVAIASNAVLPICVRSFGDGSIAAVVLRAILGAAQAPMVPCVSTFVQKWIPPEQRGFLGGMAFGGVSLGTVIGGMFTGIMIQQSGDWGLPFYVWSVVAFIWFVFFIIWAHSTPQNHPFITDEELQFLESKIGTKTKFKVPWLKILKSGPCWALLAGQYGHSFLIFTLSTYLPKYFKDILKLNIQSNAIFTAFPFMMLWLSTFMFSFFSDFMINRKLVSVRVARVLYTTVSTIVPSMLLLVVIYVGCHRIPAIALYTLAMVFIAPFYAGMKVNVNDLTRQYGGTIMAIVNGLSATAGIIGPYIAGHFAKDKSLKSWSKVFLIVFSVSVVTAFIFAIFAKAERQPWDEPETAEDTADDDINR